MNLQNQNDDPLEEAVATITREAPPADLYTRCLDNARSLDPASVKTPISNLLFRGRSWSAALVGIAALALVSVTLPFVLNSGTAFAQIESSLEAIKSLRVEIINPQSEEAIRIAFSQGEGYRLESNDRLEVDNGEYRVEVDKIRKRGVKFPTRIKTSYQARQLLDDWARLPEHTERDVFKRREDLDQVSSEETLQCYAWAESIGLTQYESLAYRDRSKKIRLLSTRHRVGNDMPWHVDSLIRLSYDPIPKQEFSADLAADFQIAESEVKQVDVNGRAVDEDVLAAHRSVLHQWPKNYGLKFGVQVRASRSYGPDVDKASRLPCRKFPTGQVDFRDEFCVLAPKEAGQRPRRFWKRYYSENGQEALVSAVSFDGTTTRSYSGGLDGRRGSGLVVGFENVTPLDDIPNYYEQLLFLRLNLLNDLTPVASELATLHLDRMHLVATQKRENWIEKEFELYRESGSGQIVYEVRISGSPANRVVGYEICLVRSGKRERLGLLDVHSHGQFEGTWYPASGLYQQTGIGLLDEFLYRFEVIDVSRLPEDAEESWWIDWPSGTSVNDQVEKRTYTIDDDVNPEDAPVPH